MIELIFVLLGLWWSGWGWCGTFCGPARRRMADSRVALIVWGLRALYRPGQWWLRWQIDTRFVARAAGRSDVGDVTRSIPVVGPMLAACGHCWYCGG